MLTIRRMIIIAAVSLAIPFTAQAQTQIPAEGNVFYKLDSGEMVTRSATLLVPARGEGDVVLQGTDMEATASRFFNRSANGRTVFYVVFDEAPGMPEGNQTVFKGTYLRGFNAAVYYGDIFTRASNSQQQRQQYDQPGQSYHHDGHGWRYIGGFSFRSDIAAD